jgi:beta-carotene 15,15'-dioxygenase
VMNPRTASAMQWQQRIFAGAAVVAIASVLLDLSLPTPWLVGLLVVLVVLVGLPHGALDPLVAWKQKLWQTPAQLARFLAIYLGLSGLTLALWLTLPGIALPAFLAYSAWHFSADWNDSLAKPLAVCPGLLVISGPALFHHDTTTDLFSLLAPATAAGRLADVLVWVAVIALAGTVAACLTRIRSARATSIELALLIGCVALLPPLLSFLVYFCGQHSPRHLLHALEDIPPRWAWRIGGLFTALSVLGGLAAIPLMPAASLTTQSIQILFIGLSILTVPHMLLIELTEA